MKRFEGCLFVSDMDATLLVSYTHLFIAAAVPTFWNTGVCTVPCTVLNSPRRAFPFL